MNSAHSWIAHIKTLVRRAFFWLPSAAPSEEERATDIGHDHRLLLTVKTSRSFPGIRQLRYVSHLFSTAERRTVLIATVIFILSVGTGAGTWVAQHAYRVPVPGGTYTEALLGEPRYVNPLDGPANDVDRDLVSLIFSGLFRMNGMTAEPDLAETYTWSDDGKTLTVIIRGDARFHNGDPVTADDVQFTIDSLQDPARTSPLAPLFRGVTAIATDTQTIQFTLERPNPLFLQLLTVGILPSGLWQHVPAGTARLADLNLKPIGSGPYRFAFFTRDSLGGIRSFTLERFDQWYGIKPYLKTLTFQFYPDRKQAEDALKSDLVQGLAFSRPPTESLEAAAERWHTTKLYLPQETVAFFNIKNSILTNAPVRQALAGVIDRAELIDGLNGRAETVFGPFPFLSVTSTTLTIEEARDALEKAGWVLPENKTVRVFAPKPKAPTATSTELALTITTSKQPELVEIAERLKRRWSLIGVKITVEALDTDTLLKRATREHTGQIILTNILLGPEQDLFPFWWSGQTGDRGLNIAQLADRDVDAALEQIRAASSSAALETARGQLSVAIQRSNPAVFLLRPASFYLISTRIKSVSPTVIASRPADRFQDLLRWYAKTGWRWRSD